MRAFAAALMLITTVPGNDQTHLDRKAHFSVLIPDGWIEVQPPKEAHTMKFSVLAPSYAKTGERCSFGSTLMPYLGGLSQDRQKQFVRVGWFKKNLAKMSMTLTSSELIDRGAYLTEIDTIKMTVQGQPAMLYRAVTVFQGAAYDYGCVIREADYLTAKPELDKVVRSFSVVP